MPSECTILIHYIHYINTIDNSYTIAGLLVTLFAGLLARGQYAEGPATGHLNTGFPWFPSVYKQMLRRFPTLHFATACFSCSPPDLNFLGPYFIYMLSVFHIYLGIFTPYPILCGW